MRNPYIFIGVFSVQNRRAGLYVFFFFVTGIVSNDIIELGEWVGGETENGGGAGLINE